ncbi:MAG: hypothetical protein LCH96_04730 [Actinobacteria bacterium]|nr:hypothetical protein [Actinomycetota bacterium]
MILAVRRALAGAALGAALTWGVGGTALAETPSPTATATATSTATSTGTATATGSSTATSEVSVTTEPDSETPDAALDNSRTYLAIGGAAVLALLAALLVFLRRR